MKQGALPRILLIGLIASLVGGSSSRAADLEESIDAELDKSMNSPAPAPTPTQPEAPATAEAPAPVEAEAPAAQTAEEPAVPPEAPIEAEAPAPAPVMEPEGRSSIANDEPNLEREKRMHRIFTNLKPVSAAKWAEMIGSRKEDVYIVQKGDSLWDISKTMFGDGFYWTKLWAENGNVENPHAINPNMGVRFIAGNDVVAPVVDVVPAQQAQTIRINTFEKPSVQAPMYREQALKEFSPDEIAAQNTIEIDELVPKPDIPPGRPRSRVLSHLPASFKSKKISVNSKYDITGLDVGKIRTYTSTTPILPTSFLLEREPASVGRVYEIEAQQTTASVGQNVFIRTTDPMEMGVRLSVLYPRGKVNDPIRGPVGPVMEVGGVVQVFEAVPGNGNIYRAQVVTSINPIRLNSVVVQAPLPKTAFSRRGTLLDVDLRVIGGENDNERAIIGESSIVYLDGGRSDGLSPGDILAVRSRRASRREDTQLPAWRRSIGLLKIVKVEEHVSTALVMEANEEIVPGDHTGGPLPEKSRSIGDLDPVPKD